MQCDLIVYPEKCWDIQTTTLLEVQMSSNEFDNRLVDATIGGAEIGIKPDTLRRWARDGHVSAYKVRGALRFRLSDLKKLIVLRHGPKDLD
jgi:excisionase family DNA binding protein